MLIDWQKVWRIRSVTASLAILFGLSCLSIACAQDSKVVPVAAKRCGCGRWTCPACQQQRLQQMCPPGSFAPSNSSPLAPSTIPSSPQGLSQLPVVPVPMDATNVPYAPAESANQPPSYNLNDGSPIPQTSAPTTDNVAQFNMNDATASNADVNELLAPTRRSSDQSSFFASNTGGLADPGLVGDFFGPTSSTASIISQDYSVQAFGILNGGLYDFEVVNGNGFNDATTSGPLVNGVAPLAQPSQTTDLPVPQEPGYSWAGGNAHLIADPQQSSQFDRFLLRYGYSKPLLVPSTFSQQRIKLAENTSPIPQSRIFFNYSSFGNVPLTDNGITVNRYSPGFEKLLFNSNTSFEMRTPFATTLNSDILLDGGTNTSHAEFGNLFFSLKHVIYRRNKLILSSGMSMTAPTADDIRIINSRGIEVVRINNESVHLMPFLGFFYKPSQRTFVQGFAQVDVDANGNPVFLNPNVADNLLNRIGRLQDMTLLYLDVNMGFWLYRSNGSGLTGIAPMIEGHFNRSLNQADCVIDPSGRTRIQLPIQEYDNFNTVSAVVFEFNRRSRLAVGYGAPIGNNKDRAFDGELRVTFNRYF